MASQVSSPPHPTVERTTFGQLPDGQDVEAIALADGRGMAVTILTYGATIQQVWVPDRDGEVADVCLGHADLAPYLAQPQFMGSTVGRVANRIAGGRFVLDGTSYQVPCNDGVNALHGGERGFDKVNWRVLSTASEPVPSVTLRHVSPDGDQGFPGELAVTATFTLDGEGSLAIAYQATTDRTTLVNITSHAYWNLAGEGSPEGAMGHRIAVHADHFLPTDPGAIPTGELRPVDGTVFDLRRPLPIGLGAGEARDDQIRIGRGYDHCWVAGRTVAAEPRPMARVEHPGSGRVLEVASDQPGIQFYSGNFLDGTSAGKSGRLYRMGDAFVLEPQMFPDTPNNPDFGSLRLEPGETYRNRIVLRFTIAEET